MFSLLSCCGAAQTGMAGMRRREALGWTIAAVELLVLVTQRMGTQGMDLDETPISYQAQGIACPYQWHGGTPDRSPAGSCWCGAAVDSYCLCTPSLAIDLVIEYQDSVVLVQRKDNGRFATMGGFVEVGEPVEAAVARELKEETGLDLAARPRLLGVWSDPRRDKRRHTVSVVFVAPAKGQLRAGDDARGVSIVPLAELPRLQYAFDHESIFLDYVSWRKFHNAVADTDVASYVVPDVRGDWLRTKCA